MMMILLGGYWILIALLSYFGSPLVIKAKYRSEPWCKDFQRESAVPYAFLGAGFLVLGLRYPDFATSGSSDFFLGLIIVGVIAVMMISKVRKKYPL